MSDNVIKNLYSRPDVLQAMHPTQRNGLGGRVMVTKRESPKRESPVKKTTRRKTAAAARTDLTDSAVMMVLESAQSGTTTRARIDPDVRRKLVAAEAYFLAERRGFAAGNELEDWITAEALVDSRLQQMQVA